MNLKGDENLLFYFTAVQIIRIFAHKSVDYVYYRCIRIVYRSYRSSFRMA